MLWVSHRDSIVKEHHTTTEATLAEEFALNTKVLGQRRFAATQDNGRQEQLVLVDEP
jgi:hypothetical protein